MYIGKFLTGAQVVYNIIYEVQQFINKYTCIDLFFFSKINQVTINTIPAGSPFIFIDQRPGILNKIHILGAELIDLGTNSLEEGRNGYGLIDCHRYITYPEFHCVEKRVN